MIAIKLLPARNGDSLLLKADTGLDRTAVLVDGGYASTFQVSTRPELELLGRAGYCLELVVATHIDADHIAGLIAFFRDNGPADSPQIIRVKDVWHNSLRSITGFTKANAPIRAVDEEILKDICRRGFPQHPQASPAEISALQGSSLAGLLLSHGYRWNGGDGSATIVESLEKPIHVAPNLRATVIGPAKSRLDALASWWLRELERSGFRSPVGQEKKFDDAFEFMVARQKGSPARPPRPISSASAGYRSLAEAHLPDDSIINASSISLIVEVGAARLLLLADSWPADILASLTGADQSDGTQHFDVIKVAHHGSLRNTSTDLLRVIDAPRYLISTNGDVHGHPDIEVLKSIVDRPAPYPRELYFNYATPASRALRAYSSSSNNRFSVHDAYTDWINVPHVVTS